MNSANPGQNSNQRCTMNKRTRKAFMLHAKHDDYKKRIRESMNIIRECYDKYENPYVSYSGGKDSTVLTHMALNHNSDANIWHWDYGEELMPRDYEREAIANLKQMGAKNITINKRIGSKHDTKSGYKQFFTQIQENKKKYSWDIALVGVRQDESNRRKHKYTKYFMEGCCYPLRKLSSNDIWAYIISNELAYHSTYDLQGEYMGWDEVRFVTFNDPEFEQLDYHEKIFFDTI